ncbi:unnamed protein product, partial [Ectocarpus sp. 6 AP-2014]
MQVRDVRRANVLSAAIAEHYNRTHRHALDQHDHLPHLRIVRIRDEPQSLRTNIWDGNCWRCDSTGRGIKQQHMLGEALGDIYGELLEISPSNLYVRSVDSEAILRGVTGMIRGLMTNAINAGAVQIETGMGREEDMLLPRLSACPRKETARLFAGPLLALLLNNLGRFTGEEEASSDQIPTRKKGSVQVYSGEVDTVGGILAALNVTEWAWPPYASNIVLELWRRTEAEPLPRVEGGQIGAEKFVRMLYNGRVVKPSFCQREECPLRTYRSHIMQFLVPEDLE